MRVVMLTVCVLGWYGAVAAAAPPSPACAAKRSQIESQISEAQARGRTHELRGLRRALQANQANCTDASLAREREERIAKAQREVAERERELQEAQHDGRPRKIASRKAKLEAAQRELAAAQQPLLQ
ncbi:MAG TPA: DUF1090 domain-containing protein [Pseudorhodoferax sp.]|nr:DUF1090 domain-containing protein [Pseudorhodoferax sp.]